MDGFAQCPTCTPDLACVSADGNPSICPEVLPEATANAYFEEVITFYLPSTVVDAGTGITADLNQVTISSVTGLPFGLTYSLNNAGGTYFPANGENHGCATICGTPLLPGSYSVNITADVLTTVLGFEIEATETFSQDFTVLPGSSGNTSFEASDVAGCGSLDVQFTALVDGSPNPTTWEWNFGNGQFSDQAVPEIQNYESPGDYLVTLETVVSTFQLTGITLTSLASGWSGDVEEVSADLFNPDPYFVLIDGSGNAVFTSGVIGDSQSGNWTGLSVELSNPPYSLEWWDEDNGGIFGSSDDFLGNASFPVAEGIQAFASTGPTGSNGFANVGLVPVTVLNDTLQIQVFSEPNTAYDVLDGVVYLDTTDVSNVLWLLYGDTLLTEQPTELLMEGWGVYQAQISNVFGCVGWTDEIINCPSFELAWNGSTLTAPSGLETYTWFYNGLEVEGANSPTLEASAPGNYAVTITTWYGCEYTCEVYTVPVGIHEIDGFKLLPSPNPCQQAFYLAAPDPESRMIVRTVSGQKVLEQAMDMGRHLYDVSQLSAGVYLLEVVSGERRWHTRLVKQ